MRIEHLALWTRDLEDLRQFYVTHFGGQAGARYENTRRGFSSYFLCFTDGARLELMQLRDLAPAATSPAVGLAHFALAVGSEAEVRRRTEQLRTAGVRILSEPRRTGDGYFESTVADPDGNIIELTI